MACSNRSYNVASLGGLLEWFLIQMLHFTDPERFAGMVNPEHVYIWARALPAIELSTSGIRIIID